MSNAGRAVFEAVGNFSGLRREAATTESALKRTRDAGKALGDDVDAGARKASTGLQGFIDKTGQLADKMDATGKSLSLKLTAPLTGIAVLGVRSFANFEKSIVSAGAKSDATAAQLKRMKDLALEMGAQTMFSAGEAAGAMDTLAAAGFNAEDAMKALPGVMKGAQATGEDLALTADTVAKAMNAFNIEAGDSTKVADLFAQAANTTALGMQDIAYGLANAGEVGPRFGQSMEGVVAMLGRLVDLGVPAASAGVAIRSSLVNLAAPTDKAQGYLKGLGIETRDAQGRMLQFPDLLEQVGDGLSLTNPRLQEMAEQAGRSARAQRDLALKTLFGVEGAKAFALALSDGKPVMLDAQEDAEKLQALQDGLAETLGKKGAKAWIANRTEAGKFVAKGEDAVRAIEAMGRASDGTADKFVDTFGETTAAKLDSFFGSLETIGITLVQTVAPALDDVTEKATTLINKIAEFAEDHDWFGPLVVGVGLFLAALGPVLIIVGQILKVVRGATRAGRGLGRAVKKMSGRGGKTTTGPASTVGDVLDGNRQEVWWARPLPVYLVKPVPGADGAGGKTAASSKSPRSAMMPVIQGNRTHDQWRRDNRKARWADRRQRAGAAVRGGGRAVGGGAAAGAGGLALGMLSGQSVGEAAKTAGIFAGLELAVMAVGKAAGAVGPAVGRAAGAVGRFTGRVLASFAKMVARAAWWSAQMIAKTLLWTLKTAASVAVWGAKMVAQIAWAAAKFIAQYAWMAAKALWNAGRIAASWLIAMGPVGWIIAGIAALVAAFVWAYKNVDWFRKGVDTALKFVGEAFRWLWNNAVQPVLQFIVKGIARLLEMWADMLDVMGKVPGFGWAKKAADKLHAAAVKANDLANGIQKIPPRKDVVISVATIYTTKGQGGADALANIQDKQAGDRRLKGMSTGGRVPGRGRGDSVLRLLEPGEFVVRRAVASRPGMLTLLAGINRGAAGVATDVLPDAAAMAGAAMRSSLGAIGAAPAHAALGQAPAVAPGNGRRGDLTVVVNNPLQERAGESFGAVLSRRAYEMGWAVA